MSTGNITIGAASTISTVTLASPGIGYTSIPSYISTTPSASTMWTSGYTSAGQNAMSVTGTVECSDLKLDGVSMKDLISKIEDRLLILTPDPAKLEKYEALKQAYNHYKTLEALIGNDKDTPTV